MCGRQSCVSGRDSGSVFQMRKLVTGSLHTRNHTHNLTQPHTIAIQPYTIIHMWSHHYTDTQPHTVIHNHTLSMTQPYTIMTTRTVTHTMFTLTISHPHHTWPGPRHAGWAAGLQAPCPTAIDRSAMGAATPARQILCPMVTMHKTWITCVQVHKGFSPQSQ